MKKELALIIIFFICIGVGYYFSTNMINFITSYLPDSISIVALNPSDGFMTLFWASIGIGLILFSIIGGLIGYWFIKDALYKHEKIIVIKNLLPICFLFFIGFIFGLYIYIGLLIPYFLEINSMLGLENIWSLNTVLVSSLMIACSIGLSFELPIIIRNGIRFGLIEKQLLQKNRAIVLLVLLIVSALITPPDIVSQILVGAPLYLLFELSLIKISKEVSK